MGRWLALGHVVATPGALTAFGAIGEDPGPYLARHAAGDWGEVPPEDSRENDRALCTGERVLSVYRLQDRTRIWIVT